MKWDIELGVPVSESLPEQGDIYMCKTCVRGGDYCNT
jgi:hypothetical protein